MKFVRDKIEKTYRKSMHKIFLKNYWSDVIPREKLEKFIKIGVSTTYFLLNIAIFFSVYFIFNRIYASAGFEKTIIVGIVVIIAMLRVFLENTKN